MAKMLEMRDKLMTLIGDLEFPILVFPVMVTCLVAIGFVLKLPCAVWEWWMAILLTLGCVFWRNRNWRRSLSISIFFSVFLVLLWTVSRVTYTAANWDGVIYHQPAIRLLSSGWNPVWQCTIEHLPKAVGLPADVFGVSHIIPMPKGVWYFCASACKFTHAYFNLYEPMSFMLNISVMLTLVRIFRKSMITAIVVGIGVFHFICPGDLSSFIVDKVVALSAVGLLATMLDCLKNKHWDFPALITYTFWMSVSKQTSCLHCGVFWLVFLVSLKVMKYRIDARRILVAFALMFSMFCVVNISPYATSWISYGHPFYPKYTVNPEKYPARDIVGDFSMRNADAMSMGHIGAYLNAFVSPELMSRYYKWRQGKKEFCPVAITWNQYPHSAGTSTTHSFRLLFCGSILFLFLFGGSSGKFLACCLLFATMALPKVMIGYLRYTPWALFGCAYCAGFVFSKINSKMQLILVILLFGADVFPLCFHLALRVDQALAIRRFLDGQVPSEFVVPAWASGQDEQSRHYFQKMFSGNLRLLKEQEPRFANVKIIDQYEGAMFNGKDLAPCCDGSFQVIDEYKSAQYCQFRKTPVNMNRGERYLYYLFFMAKTFFCRVPHALFCQIKG